MARQIVALFTDTYNCGEIIQGDFRLGIWHQLNAKVLGWSLDRLNLPLGDTAWRSGCEFCRLTGVYTVVCGPFDRGNNSTGGQVVYDCRKSLPFQDESLRGVFCEHFFEYVDWASCKGEWREIGKIQPLDTERTDLSFRCEYDMPLEPIIMVCRQSHEQEFAHDFEILRFVQYRYAFSAAVCQEYGRFVNPKLCLVQAARTPESLYVDGTK